MSELKTPSYHEDEAHKFEAAEDYKSAAKEWRLAKAASIGHNRRDRYEAAARRCEEKIVTTRVLFRVQKSGEQKGEVTAVFPDDREGLQNTDCVGCYGHIGQHGQCSLDWVRNDTRPAKPAEYEALKKELESAPYKYDLVLMARLDASI